MSEVMEPSAGSEVALIRASLPTILEADERDILGKLASKVRAHKPDISTNKGRDEIRSLAAEIASSKVTLIKLGKSLTEDWRVKTKAVNAECNIIEEKMDALKIQVRQPLTDFENAEKNRVADHEQAIQRIAVDPTMQTATSEELSEAIRARLEPEARNWQEFHQRAIDAHAAAIATLSKWRGEAQDREEEAAELARLRAAEAERESLAAIEAQRIREERIAAEARKAAEAEAERKAREAATAAQRAQEAAQREIVAAQESAAKAEASRVEAIAAAERAREAAAEKAERDKLAAIAAEQKRAADAKAAEEAEASRRAANLAHRKKINGEALADLIQALHAVMPLIAGSAEEPASQIAKEIVKALVKGEIRNCKIEY